MVGDRNISRPNSRHLCRDSRIAPKAAMGRENAVTNSHVNPHLHPHISLAKH